MKRRTWLTLAAASPLPAVKPPREPMPRFQAKSIDGELFTRENLKGKVVLVQHWATWCGYCRKDEPAVEQIIKDHAKDGLIVLAINAAESKAKVQDYLNEHRRTAQIVMTPETNLARLFEGAGLPAYILIDRESNVAAMQPGSGGLLALREMLKEVDLRK
ncbi:MAG: TlpA family protein disulfide reductase [Bryobacteraceae bacterium]